ncbi:L-lactate permease [Haloferula rosea]|uniref:L-lactate permease n=1 Tax=Haloferula rosea TaxID=490093 RepID=A0A934R9Y1_9BACT|nr:L-lactate permease [Haloferula rosea]MBK1825504.1 L-lactate permease [Haloferula rosea]
MKEVILALAPIVVLVVLMTKANPWPSYKALPLAALLMYLVKTIGFELDANTANAVAFAAVFKAFTPILIVWGAIFLFSTMEHSGAMDVIRKKLATITGNRIGQLMIVGWAFAFLVEGASGFGTPAALAAPILVGLGFTPVRAALFCLIMNSVPVSFGAVGTPTWFGFQSLGLSEEQLIQIGIRSTVIHGVASLVVPLIALRFMAPWKEIRENLVFIFLSVLSCVVPYIILSFFSLEFPAIIGGSVGLIATVFFANHNIGLKRSEGWENREQVAGKAVLKAAFPIWATVLVLVVTRIQQLGLKGLMTSMEPLWSVGLGSLGEFTIAKSLTVSMEGVFGAEQVDWAFKTLYVPSLIPFILVSLISFRLFRMEKMARRKVISESAQRMYLPGVALFGALILVELLRYGGDASCAAIIGSSLADLLGPGWKFGAPFLGALGSFFSGSATVSAMTFGAIQENAALSIGLDPVVVLAMQSVGGSMGNMVCIHNIVAVSTVVGLQHQEGYLLKRTIIPLVVYGTIAGVVGAIML